MNSGDLIDGWSIDEELGSGGNATVWRAHRDGQSVALKILKSRNVHSEPYRRFRQEVAALRAIGDHPGVLPIIEVSLPDRPTRATPAWLAMPVAIPIRDALSDAPLQNVVAAVASVAETLADLADRHELGHRDIKPPNLYEFEGRWVVGDFGLVDVPGQDDLTSPDKSLGPTNFMPYEMITDPSTADPHPADVYSLAKTLWVLATGQRWAPQGEQAASNRAVGIGQYRTHAHAAALDRIVERATKHHPTDRPTMKTLAGDLQAWLRLPNGPPDVADLASIGARLRQLAAPRLSDAQRIERFEELTATAADRLAAMLRPFEASLQAEYAVTEVDAYNEAAESMLKHRAYGGTPQMVAEEIRATVLQGPGDFPIELIVGRKVGVTDDGMMRVAGICFIGHQSMGGGDAPWQVEMPAVPADSLQAETTVDDLGRQILENFPVWLERFLARLAGDQ